VKILFVHEVDYRNKVIFEIHEFPELMALRGHDISFFQFAEKDGNGNSQSKNGFSQISGRAHVNAKINLITPWHTGKSFLDRFVCFGSSYASLKREFADKHYDAVVLYAVPTYGLQVLNLARKHRVPVMFRALDVSHKIRKSIFSKLILKIEKRIYRECDLLSANNPAMRDYCVSISGRSKETIVNYPPLDLLHFEPRKPNPELALSLGLSQKSQVITYMGSFFYFSGLEEVIKDFARRISSFGNLKLLLIGGGEQDSELRQLVSNLNLEDSVVFTGFVPYQDLPDYLALSDVAINPLEKSLVTDVAFPHKVLQYLAAGIPVVSTQLDGLFKTFGNESGIRWANGASEIIDSSIDILDSESKLQAMAELGLSSVNELFGVAKAVDAFEDAIRSMTSNI
jgi:glycosyltransferase involved in cell wall biosynthesis